MKFYLYFLNLQYVAFVTTTTTTWKYSVYEYGDYLVHSGQATMSVFPFQCSSTEQ